MTERERLAAIAAAVLRRYARPEAFTEGPTFLSDEIAREIDAGPWGLPAEGTLEEETIVEKIAVAMVDEFNDGGSSLDMAAAAILTMRDAMKTLAALTAKRDAELEMRAGALDWAVHRWNDEVKNRPLQNIHRSDLDITWRQVMRYFGGDPDKLVGPEEPR